MAFNVGAVLKKVRLFHSLNDTEVRDLEAGMVERRFDPGKCLMKVDEQGTEFFIIVSGKCEVITKEGDKVAELMESDYCGEQGLLRSTVRNATVRAIQPTVTLCCDKKTFDRVLVGSVKFARRDAKRKAVLAVIEQPTEPLGDTRKTQKQRTWLMEKIADNLMFSSLDETKRLTAVDQMYIEHVDAGIDLISQGDEDARTFYVVESGEFDVYVNNEHVATIPRGGCFGELALMYGTARAATCRANQNSVVWVCDRNAFRSAITRMHQQQFQANIEFLRGVAILQPLLTRELALVDEAMMPCHYDAGDIIIKQGDDPDKFYIIKRGVCMWSKKNPDGTVERGDIPTGGFFGELALLNDQPRAATVAAKTEVVC
jgi:cAMP-dependent protein kinase regulator